jgi:hypothetical protein
VAEQNGVSTQEHRRDDLVLAGQATRGHVCSLAHEALRTLAALDCASG